MLVLYNDCLRRVIMSTIAAIATPNAAGGIGIIRISGEDAINITAKPMNSLCVGRFPLITQSARPEKTDSRLIRRGARI